MKKLGKDDNEVHSAYVFEKDSPTVPRFPSNNYLNTVISQHRSLVVAHVVERLKRIPTFQRQVTMKMICT